MVHKRDGHDPDAYKLMDELGYNFSKPPSPGNVINANPYRSNDAQKIVQK